MFSNIFLIVCLDRISMHTSVHRHVHYVLTSPAGPTVYNVNTRMGNLIGALQINTKCMCTHKWGLGTQMTFTFMTVLINKAFIEPLPAACQLYVLHFIFRAWKFD